MIQNSKLVLKLVPSQVSSVLLEDIDLKVNANHVMTSTWGDWFDTHLQSGIGQRLCIVHDDVMNFLLETATEVVARIALHNDTKTVQKGALWYEESLPAESVLVALVLSNASRNKNDKTRDVTKVIKDLCGKAQQFGGKATVGRGICQLWLKDGAA